MHTGCSHSNNERFRLTLAGALAAAGLATLVWGGTSGVAIHYVGATLLVLAASIGGFSVLSAKLPGARLTADKRGRDPNEAGDSSGDKTPGA